MQNGDYSTYTSSRSDRERRRRRRRQARRRLLLLVIIVLVVAGAIAAVALRGRGSEAAGGSGGDASQAAATSKASPKPTPPPKVWAASTGHPVRVWVGGDSMGGELGFALSPQLGDAGVFKPITFYKESSGICRYDFYDWQKEIESVVRTAKPQAAVIMLGTNDTQSIAKSGGGWIAWGDVAWKRAYGQRVGDIIDTMLGGGARRIYWVGMPIMGEKWRNKRMQFINTIFAAEAAKRPGAEYVDVWDLYTRSDGSFDPSLRAGDGVHFTVEGQSLLAEKVYKAIAADWHPVKPESPGASPSPSASPSASSSSL